LKCVRAEHGSCTANIKINADGTCGNDAGQCERRICECYSQFGSSLPDSIPNQNRVSGGFDVALCQRADTGRIFGGTDPKKGSAQVSSGGALEGACCLSRTDHFQWYNPNRHDCCDGQIKDSC